MFKSVMLLLTIIMISCSFRNEGSAATISATVANIQSDVSYLHIDYINYPDSGTYFMGDTMIFDLTYNISDENYKYDVDSSFQPYFYMTTFDTNGGAYRMVEFNESDRFDKLRLEQQSATIRIITSLYDSSFVIDSSQYINPVHFSLKSGNSTVQHYTDFVYSDFFYRPKNN